MLDIGTSAEASFKVQAFDDSGPIGEGDHVRAIVFTERLLAGAAKRKPGS